MSHISGSLTICVLTYLRPAFALPINETEPSWVPEPKGRGTLGLVLPCLITLALCVWTTIHVNVNPEPTKRRMFAFKVAWLLLGAFAPEIVLWCSLSQYWEACAIRTRVLEIRIKRYNWLPPPCTSIWHRLWVALFEIFPKSNSNDSPAYTAQDAATTKDTSRESPPTRLHNFGMESAFFVLMGGYVLYPVESDCLPVTLTPEGFIQLYEAQRISEDDLDPSLIIDKTKADGLAKLIVCLQALWFVLQGIGRLAKSLPIPLIELHTIMHVICAVPMYGFWWYKPLDVRFPLFLNIQYSNEELHPPHATSEQYDDWRQNKSSDLPVGEHAKPPAHESSPRPPDHLVFGSDVILGVRSQVELKFDQCSSIPPEYKSPLPPLTCNAPGKRWDRMFRNAMADLRHCNILVPLSLVLGSYIEWHRTFQLRPTSGGDPHTKQQLATVWEQVKGPSPVIAHQQLCVRARMIAPRGHIRSRNEPKGGTWILVLLSMLYGGMHAVAWNSHLPTTAERSLWRISSIVAGSCVPTCLLLWHCTRSLGNWLENVGQRLQQRSMLWPAPQKRIGYRLGNFLEVNGVEMVIIPAVIFVITAAVAFFLGRIFLLVESFLSLRSLPKGSFDTVSWSSYWAHL